MNFAGISADARLSCGVVCVILRLAISVEHRLVTDRRTDTLRQLIRAPASVARIKTTVIVQNKVSRFYDPHCSYYYYYYILVFV